MGGLHIMLLSNCVCENWCSEGHTLCEGISEFLALIFTLLVWLRCYSVWECNALNSAWILWKPVHVRKYSSYGSKLNYIYPHIMKFYNILKVVNTLMKSTYYVTEYTICNIVFVSSSAFHWNPTNWYTNHIQCPPFSLIGYTDVIDVVCDTLAHCTPNPVQTVI